MIGSKVTAFAYRLSSYFHKNRNNYDSLLHAGPVWDFNLSFGNADYCNGGETNGWAFKFHKLDISKYDFYQVLL